MPFLNSVFYEVWGDAPAPWITLINGYSRTHQDFRGMGRELVRQGWRVLAFDNRGAGQTEATALFTYADLVGDVVSLWDHLGAMQSHLMGISFGGMIATHVAAMHPARVKSLVLASTTPIYEWLTGGQRPIPVEDLLNFFSPTFQKKSPVVVKALVKEIAKNESAELRPGLRLQERIINAIDLRPWLPKIKCPTLILHGEEDGIADIRGAHLLAENIAGAQMKLLPHVGHLFLAEAPAQFYQLVGDFCAAHRG